MARQIAYNRVAAVGRSTLDPRAFAPILWLDPTDPAARFQDSALTALAAADTDPLGGMADKSGGGHHLTQATGANRPLLRLAVQNGLPVMRFDGSNDRLFTNTWPALTAVTGFMVVKWTTTGTTTATIQSLIDSDHNNLQGWVVQDRPDLSKHLTAAWIQSVTSSSAESADQVGNGSFRLLSWRLQANLAELWADRVADGTAAGSGSHTEAGVLSLGAWTNSGGSVTRFLAGDVGDVILYPRVLSDADPGRSRGT